jgi:hypothetical protein
MGAVLLAVVAAMLTYHFIELRVRHRQDLM